MKKIYMLICEDASNLGGPMGSESTYHVFSKPFSSLGGAKEYAKSHNGKINKAPMDWKWRRDGKNRWSIDARTHLYSIEETPLGR